MESNEVLDATAATAERLSLMASNLEQTVADLERRLNEMQYGGRIGQLIATVEAVPSAQVEALEARLAEAERQIAAMHASAATAGAPTTGRRTLSATAATLLAKHGVGDGPVEAATLDSALSSLPVEQRIAVKSQLLRAGLLN